MNNGKKSRLTLLTHFLTRDAPLIAMEAWYNGRMYKFNEYTGLIYHTTLFRHNDKVFEFYTDLKSFEEKLPKNLSIWIKANENKFMKIHEMMINSLNKIKEIQNSPIKTEKEMLDALKDITDLWSNGYIGVLISHHLAMFHEKFMKKGIRLYEDRIVSKAISWRKAEGNVFFNDGVEAINLLLDKIADIKKCNAEDLKHLTLKELGDFIKNTKLSDKINQRKKFPYIYFKDKVIHYKGTSSFLKKFGIKLNKEKPLSGIAELKGSVANKGKVKGTVKIITNRRQLGNFADGDVIVANMTSPWYVPIMEKSGAIVTDEGGITCHAAIISREMNKPCIIGTKFATKVLKDGDLVEVDANTGIVKKLK